jgi:hypothetical protein
LIGGYFSGEAFGRLVDGAEDGGEVFGEGQAADGWVESLHFAVCGGGGGEEGRARVGARDVGGLVVEVHVAEGLQRGVDGGGWGVLLLHCEEGDGSVGVEVGGRGGCEGDRLVQVLFQRVTEGVCEVDE